MGYFFFGYFFIYDVDDVSELNEEDVWDLGVDGLFDNIFMYDGIFSSRVDSFDMYWFLNMGRRWMGVEYELGLFVVFVDYSSRGYGCFLYKLVGSYVNYIV